MLAREVLDEIKSRLAAVHGDRLRGVILYGSEAEARAVKSQYGVVGIPHTFVIDRQGIIRHRDHPIRLRDWHVEPWL